MRDVRIDVVYRNGRLLTMDRGRPTATTVGVHHGRIVGLDDDLDGATPDRVVDLGGACVVPGFNDAHNHMAQFGMSLSELPLKSPPLRTLDELYDAVAARVAEQPTGSWIIGSGYDQNKLGGQHPQREQLDRIAPDHKVWLKHTSAHMCVVNGRVLREIGLTDAGSDDVVPVGGAAVRRPDGTLTGLLQEQAQSLVRDLVYPYSVDDVVAALHRAGARYLSEGITSCTEAGIGGGWIGHTPVELTAYQEARERGALPVRVTVMVASDALHDVAAREEDPAGFGLDLGLRSGLGDEWLRIGAMKVFIDGSLLGRTAAMTEGFADEPGNRGYLQESEEVLRRRILGAHHSGWQVAAHAIGDAAVDFALDCFAAAQRRWPREKARHRIEHCAMARPEHLQRLAELAVIPVPQQPFVSEIGDGMARAVGAERVAWCYRFKSFLDAGLVLPGSSDRPVVDGRPLLGIHDAVHQRTQDGNPFHPQEALTPTEALRAYTVGSAYATFDEHRKGRLLPGMLADMAVLSDDPTDPAVTDRIRDIDVVATVVGGRTAYDPSGLDPDSPR